MCGRFTLFTDFENLVERFDIGVSMDENEYFANYNAAPTQFIVTVLNDGKQNRMGKLKWGLIPSWSKDEKVGYKMIKARSETVDSKPSYRQAFLKRRCLIPMDSFFE